MDIVDPATRSKMMSRISGKNTAPEVRLRSALHRLGLRYRIHSRELPGKPDIVFPKWKAVCFVHGCFWHRHPGCNLAATPSTRPTFWETKFSANVSRDVRNKDALKEAGWRVAIVWECSLGARNTEHVAAALRGWLKGTEPLLEIGKPMGLRAVSRF
jgi:DNA mismatch endonuclease (patch repair protein)